VPVSVPGTFLRQLGIKLKVPVPLIVVNSIWAGFSKIGIPEQNSASVTIGCGFESFAKFYP
jgi:hypothetical protein